MFIWKYEIKLRTLFSKFTTNIKTDFHMQLKNAYCEAITDDVELQVKIAKVTGRTIETVKRWARENNEYLLLFPVLEVIKAHLSIAKSENITETNADKLPKQPAAA